MHRGKRRSCSQRIAADIAEDEKVEFFKCIEERPVGTARTEVWRPLREIFLLYPYLWCMINFSLYSLFQGPFYSFRRQFKHMGHEVLAMPDLVTHGPDLGLKKGIKLFHHHNSFYLAEKLSNHLFRKRPDHAKLQI